VAAVPKEEECKTATDCLARRHRLELQDGEDDKHCSMCGASLLKGLWNCAICDFEFCGACQPDSLKFAPHEEDDDHEMISVDIPEQSEFRSGALAAFDKQRLAEQAK
jgi:hypothetical protein